MSLTRTAQRHAEKIRWISLAVIVAALLFVSRSLPLGQVMQALRGWIDGLGLWGPVVFGLIYVAATVLFVPGLILTLAGGAIFGLLVGTIVISISSVTGAGCAFLIARYLARDKIAGLARKNSRFDAVDRAIEEGGWKIVALLRLSPAVPFNLQNYLFGLTAVGFWAYFFTSWIAMLPGTFMYVYVGHITGAAVAGGRERTTAEWAFLVVGLVATIAVSAYITILARKKLSRQTELDEEMEVEVEDARDEEPEAREPGGWPWGATVAALFAVLAVGGAAWVHANPGIFGTLFGPGAVELEEAYEPRPGGPSVDHSTYGELLKAHVDENGWVDYRGLMEDEPALDSYLETLAEAPFDALGRDEKLALLANAYNAFTLKLILDHWPVDSIKDIPSSQRWKAERWNVGGNVWSLDQIEHEQIRPKFVEPRVHFILVCAAVGCPPLPREPFEAEILDRQIEERTRWVHDHQTWHQYDSERNVVRLTPLYDWYGEDFLHVADSILDFVARYSEPLARLLERGEEPEVEFLHYDWALNSAENAEPR